mgnify:CR=1 FL=1
MGTEVKLLVGLGNPGPEYERTRHNAGFWLVEDFCRRHAITLSPDTKSKALIGRWQQGAHDLRIVLPQNFMNRSGFSVAALANFYKIPASQILVAYDELDLPPGVAKFKKGGGAGGHNGIKDIIAQTGSQDFMRLRIGIGHPGDKTKVTGFVLGKASANEQRLPDPRLDKLAAIVNPERVIPTTMEFVDIAGLVKGASKGEGLGNQFLANIRETDAIGHVVRCFEDDNIVHVSGGIDPADDIDTINTELALADLDSVDKSLYRLSKKAKGGDAQAKAEIAVLEKLKPALDEGKMARSVELSKDERATIRSYNLLTLKPTMYIANVNEDGFENNPHLDKVREIAATENAVVVPVCAAIESEIAELDEADKEEFLSELGQDEPGLNRVIRGGYELLNLHTYFTAGVKEVRAWTVKVGSTAPQAAGRIHTDFEKGFIRAEIVGYDDYIANNGEQGAKDAGKWRLEGKEYIVKDGDVIHFRFNV